MPAAIPKKQYRFLFTLEKDDKEEHIINYKFNLHDIVCLVCCSLVGAWYLLKKVSDEKFPVNLNTKSVCFRSDCESVHTGATS